MHVFFFLFLSVRVSAEGCVRSLSLCCYTSTLSPLFLWFHETGTIVTDAYKYIYVCKCWECTKKKDKQTHRQKKKKRCSSTTSAAISFMMGEWSCVTLRVAFAFFFLCMCVFGMRCFHVSWQARAPVPASFPPVLLQAASRGNTDALAFADRFFFFLEGEAPLTLQIYRAQSDSLKP